MRFTNVPYKVWNWMRFFDLQKWTFRLLRITPYVDATQNSRNGFILVIERQKQY